jgi:CHAD domain-containing protein
MKHTFEQYFRKRLKTIRKRLILPVEAFTPMVFHRLRVEIKRINALMALIAFHHTDFPRQKYFRPFRRLFKRVGNIRDSQVEAELIERYGLRARKGAYWKALQKRQHQYWKAFRRWDLSRLLKQMNRSAKQLSPYLKRLSETQWQQYLLKTRQSVREQLARRSPSEDQLHDVRKTLKELFYNATILPSTPLMIKSEMEQMNALQDLLGNWHDQYVTLARIKRACRQISLTDRQRRRLNRIRKTLHAEKDALLARIRQQAKCLYGPSPYWPLVRYGLTGTFALAAIGYVWTRRRKNAARRTLNRRHPEPPS